MYVAASPRACSTDHESRSAFAGGARRRRAFVGVLFGAAAWPVAVRSQPRRVSRIGFLGLTSPDTHARLVNAFRRGLDELGYVEGQNIVLEYRWAKGATIAYPS